jgi:hypothetical protein
MQLSTQCAQTMLEPYDPATGKRLDDVADQMLELHLMEHETGASDEVQLRIRKLFNTHAWRQVPYVGKVSYQIGAGFYKAMGIQESTEPQPETFTMHPDVFHALPEKARAAFEVIDLDAFTREMLDTHA